MKQEEKRKLAKLAKLENEKTSIFLVTKAKEIKNRIATSTNNDEIFESLDILDAFVFRVPDVALEIVQIVIGTERAPQMNVSPIGSFRGKNYEDVAIKALDLLGQIRYSKPDELLTIVAPLVQREGSSIGKKAQDVLKSLANYDYFILTKTKVGYGVQRKVLDFVLTMKEQDKLSRFDVIETVAHELLSTEIEGREWTKEDTLTFHSGALNASDSLRDIRKEIMEMLSRLYQKSDDTKIKLRIVRILGDAVRSPMSVVYGDDLAAMLQKDSEYITKVFRSFVFPDNKTNVGSLAVAKAVDELLYWFKRHSKYTSKEVVELRKDILNDSLYALFRLLVSDDITYREEEGWDTAENKRKTEIQNLITSITVDNVSDWQSKLNKIAEQNELVERWTYIYFREFVKKLSSSKRDVASLLLTRAFELNSALVNFVGSFLEGFREVNDFEMWDKFVRLIIDSKNPSLISNINHSLIRFGDNRLTKEIRVSDFDILSDLVEERGDFAFLKNEVEKNAALHHSIINVLISNYDKNPSLIEDLIISEVDKNPQFLEMYVRELSHALWRNYIDYGKLGEKATQFIKVKLIGISDLHWESQQLLLDLGKKDLQIILDVFMGRIALDVAQKEDRKKDLDRTPHYDAIPYHFNDELRTYVGTHPDYLKKISGYLAESTPEWSVYNWDLGELIERIGVSFKEAIMTLVEKGDIDSLRRAVNLMNSVDGGDLELLMDIVRKTDDKRVLDKIASLVYSTGVVSGEYGIAQAYESKAKQLEQYKSDKNPNVQKFIKQTIKTLKASAEQEFKRSDEEKQIRKIEFEG